MQKIYAKVFSRLPNPVFLRHPSAGIEGGELKASSAKTKTWIIAQHSGQVEWALALIDVCSTTRNHLIFKTELAITSTLERPWLVEEIRSQIKALRLSKQSLFVLELLEPLVRARQWTRSSFLSFGITKLISIVSLANYIILNTAHLALNPKRLTIGSGSLKKPSQLQAPISHTTTTYNQFSDSLMSPIVRGGDKTVVEIGSPPLTRKWVSKSENWGFGIDEKRHEGMRLFLATRSPGTDNLTHDESYELIQKLSEEVIRRGNMVVYYSTHPRGKDWVRTNVPEDARHVFIRVSGHPRYLLTRSDFCITLGGTIAIDAKYEGVPCLEIITDKSPKPAGHIGTNFSRFGIASSGSVINFEYQLSLLLQETRRRPKHVSENQVKIGAARMSLAP